jgi:hypothetical protein
MVAHHVDPGDDPLSIFPPENQAAHRAGHAVLATESNIRTPPSVHLNPLAYFLEEPPPRRLRWLRSFIALALAHCRVPSGSAARILERCHRACLQAMRSARVAVDRGLSFAWLHGTWAAGRMCAAVRAIGGQLAPVRTGSARENQRLSILVLGLTFMCGIAVGAWIMASPSPPRVGARVPRGDIVLGSPAVEEPAPLSPRDPVATRGFAPSRTAARAVSAHQSTRQRARVTPTQFRGSLTVQSTPPGADVYVNGHKVGTTPLSLRNQRAGSYAVRVQLAGYVVWTAGIQVVANQRNVVKTSLQRRP